MKKFIYFFIFMLLITSCATVRRQYRNYEVWFPGKIAQKNQLKGNYSGGCRMFPKPILKINRY